jgi:hypothetical protein
MALIRPISAGQGLDPGAAPSTSRDSSVAHGLANAGSAIDQAAEMQQRLEEMERKRNRFAAELLWQGTQQGLEGLRLEALENVAPGAAEFTLSFSEAMDTRYTEFLDALPADQQARFMERVAADREARLHWAAADEVRERRLWYERGIASAVGAAAEEIAIDPAVSDARRQAINDLIEEADLPPARLAELRREADAVLDAALVAPTTTALDETDAHVEESDARR